MINLYPNPRLRGEVPLFRQRRRAGDFAGGLGFYVHTHASARLEPIPDGFGLRVEGSSRGSNDSHVCPGGRNGGMRLGMVAGRSYTFAADVMLDRPLEGFLRKSALRVAVGWKTPRGANWGAARSRPAINVAGTQRLWVSFHIPDDANEAWITLNLGAAAGAGSAVWSRLSLTEGAHPPSYFDGTSPDTDCYVHSWTGRPDKSPSRRELRSGARNEPDLKAMIPVLAFERDTQALEKVADRLDPASSASSLCRAVLTADADPKDALRLCGEAVQRDPGQFEARRLAAQIAVKRDDDAELIELLQPAIEDSRMGWPIAYPLGDALRRAGDRTEAKDAYRRGAERDHRITDEGANRLLDVTSHWFPVRSYLWRFLEPRIAEIREEAAASRATAEAAQTTDTAFVYWAQGIGNSPPVVQACHRSLQKYTTIPLAVLRDEDIPYWIDMDTDIFDRTQRNRTHFSDILRIELLKTHGGMWFDATCMLGGPVPPLDELLGASDIFAFRYSELRISSWFMAARKSSHIIHMLSAALSSYWRSHDRLINYYLLHHVFEVLALLDDEFRSEWDKADDRPSRPPHHLQGAMYDTFDNERMESLLSASFVHKLTYKLDPSRMRSDSMIARLARESSI